MLPELIEIVPLAKPVQAQITVPGSKSITNRALILAALAEGETTLQGALWSEDTQVMVDSLQELGFMVAVAPDPNEECNRTITVYGKGGSVPPGGTGQQPVEVFVGNAGTAARFLAAFVCLGKGVYRLHGIPRMHERPQAALFQALRELGYQIDSPNEKLPAVIHGGGVRPGKCRVSIAESSQFASALILCSLKGGWSIEVVGQSAEEAPYVKMTDSLLATFPHRGGVLPVEADASSGSYFLAAQQFVSDPTYLEQSGTRVPLEIPPGVTVARWPKSGWQVDERFPEVLANIPALRNGLGSRENLPLNSDFARDFQGVFESSTISRSRDLGDSIMMLVVMAPFALGSLRFTDLGRLRLQECERVVALRTELTKCGARVLEEGDTLTVYPSRLHGAEIESYNDHRMAMCFAILGLKVPGIRIKNPACVKKTFPNFFQKLVAPPPGGLGAIIRDAHTGRNLGLEELFAT